MSFQMEIVDFPLLLNVSARKFSYINLVRASDFLPVTIEHATMTQSQSFQSLSALSPYFFLGGGVKGAPENVR